MFHFHCDTATVLFARPFVSLRLKLGDHYPELGSTFTGRYMVSVCFAIIIICINNKHSWKKGPSSPSFKTPIAIL